MCPESTLAVASAKGVIVCAKAPTVPLQLFKPIAETYAKASSEYVRV
jgi:hypothetical protein